MESTQGKWYQKGLGIILLIFVFFPVGLFLMWKYASWGKMVKWGVTGAFVLLLAIGAVTNNSNEHAQNPPNPTPKAVTQTPETIPAKTPKPTKHELDAEVRFSDVAFQITNKEDSDWTDCRLELNSGLFKGGYVYKTAIIHSQNPLVISFGEFTKGEGTRFNSYDTKPQSLSISCEVAGIHGFGYYAVN